MIELIEEVPRVEVVAVGAAARRSAGEVATLGIDVVSGADIVVQPPPECERDPVAAWAEALGAGWLTERLRGAALVVVVAALGECDGGLAPLVARSARSAGAWTVSVVVLPAQAEPGVLRRARTARTALRGASDTLVDLHSQWQRLQPALEVLLDMVRSSTGEGFDDLDRLRFALRGRCTVGLGDADAGTLMDSARSALADLARQGADASRAEGLLVCVRGPADIDPDEVGEVVGTLRHATGGAPTTPGYVVDGGPPRVLLLQAGGRVVPTLT